MAYLCKALVRRRAKEVSRHLGTSRLATTKTPGPRRMGRLSQLASIHWQMESTAICNNTFQELAFPVLPFRSLYRTPESRQASQLTGNPFPRHITYGSNQMLI